MRVFRGLSQISAVPRVLTIGNFDGVHLGHRRLLREVLRLSQTQGAVPTVLTFEPHPREFFSPDSAPPRLSCFREKIETLSECGMEQVVVCSFNAALAKIPAQSFAEDILLKRLCVRHLVVGDDFCFGAGRQGDLSLLRRCFEKQGAQVEALSEVAVGTERASSSHVRAALAEGDLPRAARLLGRDYRMDGQVMPGQKLGRQLGFPTANVYIRHNPLPLSGVFAVRVETPEGKRLEGVANLGVRPTVGGTRPLLEVHLLDFSGDLYGQHLRVSFLQHLRREEKFPDLAHLKAQIARDISAARDYFRP